MRANAVKDSPGFARILSVRDVGRLSPRHYPPSPSARAAISATPRIKIKEQGMEYDRDIMQAMVASWMAMNILRLGIC